MEGALNTSANYAQVKKQEEMTNMGDHLEQPPIQTNEIDLALNLETRFQRLLTELQMYRAGMVHVQSSDSNVGVLQREVAVSKALAEQAQHESDKATAIAQRLVQEYDAEAKKSAILQTTLRLVESERDLLQSRIQEQVCSNETRGRQEAERQARLAAHDAARAQLERQLTRLQKTVDVLQRNHQRMENDIKKLEVEMTAARGQHELMQHSEQRQEKRLEITVSKLQKAYADIARLSALCGKEENQREGVDTQGQVQQRQRERELQQQVAEERAAAEGLREALATAAAAQTRLLALLGNTNHSHQQNKELGDDATDSRDIFA